MTPDSSRSCTPISIGASVPSPGCSLIGILAGKGDTTPSKETSGPIECQWKDCNIFVNNGEIMEHIRTCHVQSQKGKEKVVCLWTGCKVYNTPSSSKSWLDRHILFHSGDKPFRCIVAGCGARFTTQGGLERHVNSHFNAQEQSPNQKHSKHGREDTPTKLFKRKRLKQKRPAIKGKLLLMNVNIKALWTGLIDIYHIIFMVLKGHFMNIKVKVKENMLPGLTTMMMFIHLLMYMLILVWEG